MHFINKFINKIFPKRFDKYWKKIENSQNIDSTLRHITNNFINSKSYKLISNYWHILNISNYKSLSIFGAKKYGSTIAKNYYTFTEMHHDEWFEEIINNLKDSPYKIDSTEAFKKQDGLSLKESVTYNYLCYLLFFSLKKTDAFQHLTKLNDKTYLGFNDPFIKINDINITTDKIISLLDYEKIQKAFEIKSFKKVLEIGAGSGRTCEAILSIEKNFKYILCDIPPAIYISYSRLKLAFPDKTISLLTDINNKIELEKKIENSDIAFIFPHQLEMLNENSVDLTLAIDCMHEMDKSTIQYYFKLFDYFTKNFYLSIWEKTDVPYSKNILGKKNKLDYNSGDYAIPENWKNIFKEKIVFPSNMISLGFKIKE
ncbi:putative sugar O-methyltransferase [Candidatus Pelagibacter sp.]|jgi:putative sugar O-methyltransferase|nr:putative sugar O-methyltransferase [Candidatus Pelagibacter sp.]